MRIPESALYNQVINDILTADRRRITAHSQLSSGRRLQRPSDNPVDVITALRYRTGLAEIGQFLANAREARDWLDATESALRNANSLVQRAREVAVMGANGSLPAGSLTAMADEVRQLRDEMIQLGNTSHGAWFIFGGYRTTAAPFDAAGNYLGDAGVVSREIGPGVSLGVNLPGAAGSHPVFSPALAALDQLANDLQAGNTAAVGADITALDGVIDSFLSVRAQVGAKTNRIELAEARLGDFQFSLTRLQSNLEEVDIAQAQVDLSVQENAYRVALASAARLVQNTLLDFLK